MRAAIREIERQKRDEIAIVYMRFSDTHEDRVVKAAISAGKWWDGTGPADHPPRAPR